MSKVIRQIKRLEQIDRSRLLIESRGRLLQVWTRRRIQTQMDQKSRERSCSSGFLCRGYDAESSCGDYEEWEAG